MAGTSTIAGIDKQFIVSRQGKDMVLYIGLLDLAHRSGLKSIATSLIQAPSADNGHTAICHAVVTTERGTFSGIGDANPENVGRMIAMHCIRMAETRSKARALRDALNVGGVAFEEMGPEEEDTSTTERAQQRYAPPVRQQQAPPRQLNPHNADANGEIADDSAKPATAKMLATLADLKDQYDSISIDSPHIAIPAELTRGAARELKAKFETAINDLLADSAALDTVGVV